jgi:hypothetical protein
MMSVVVGITEVLVVFGGYGSRAGARWGKKVACDLEDVPCMMMLPVPIERFSHGLTLLSLVTTGNRQGAPYDGLHLAAADINPCSFL